MFSNVSNGSSVPVSAVVRKHVYTVTERNEKSFWTKIGMAFQNRDGSLTVRLDAVPINGVLQIRDEDYGARQRDEGQGHGRSRNGGAQ
jgi:hypothetical protein